MRSDRVAQSLQRRKRSSESLAVVSGQCGRSGGDKLRAGAVESVEQIQRPCRSQHSDLPPIVGALPACD